MSEEKVMEFALRCWQSAANAYRMYPDNKHTFSSVRDFLKSEAESIGLLSSLSPDNTEDEEILKREVANNMACAFLDWFVDDKNGEVTETLTVLPAHFTTKEVFERWHTRYFNPKTVSDNTEDFGPEGSNSDLKPVASHSSGVGNSIEQEDEYLYDSVYMEVVELVEKDNIQCEFYKETAKKLMDKYTIFRKRTSDEKI
jgi:hypothetical protein